MSTNEGPHPPDPRSAAVSFITTEHFATEGVTEIVKMPNRGHALTINSGWREVADKALGFVTRFV